MTEGLIIDCFCGGGGATEGIEQALHRSVDIGVNHDKEAIRLHMVNHPETLHLTEDIFTVDLEKYVAGRHVALMWASPDCTQFSKAKGSKPREHGIRILPWAVHMHASKILPDVVIMENVEEIQQWGDLDENGRPIEKEKGKEYLRFMKAMEDIGYQHESWELVAADYGAPTTRKRWYAVFRRDGEKIVRPDETHSKTGDLFRKRWVPVSTCLDFNDVGASIFERKRPLAENTQKRIARGIKKFVLNNPRPFIVPIGYGENKGQAPRVHDIEEPLRTIVGKDKFFLCTPYLIQYHSETAKNDVRGQTVDEPLQTIDTSNRYGLASVFITKFYKSGTGQEVTEPLHTITTSPGHFGLVSAFLTKYYGSGGNVVGVNEPLPTITTLERFGLVNVLIDVDGETYTIADIFMRMLKPEELKLAQGFPKEYVIDHDIDGREISRKEQVAKIGNSVVPMMARRIVEANCSSLIAAA